MTIEEMFGKRDIQSMYMATCQDMIKGSKLLPSEDLERDDDIKVYEKFVLSKFKEYETDVIIQFGWAFTKEYFHRLMKLFDYTENGESKLHCLYFLPLMGVIYTTSEEKLRDAINDLNKLNPEYILKSNLNLLEIYEADNGVEFKFNNNIEVVKFEEKPKSLKLVKDLEMTEFSEEDVKKDE